MDSSKKMVHLSGLEMGWIRSTCIFHMIFFLKKMYLLVSHIANYFV